MVVPSSTIDLIKILKDKYPDKIETDESIVGTPEYWKKVGIIEFIRDLEFYINKRR